MVSSGKPLPREYSLANHQGNIRSTFGMLHDTDVYYATMETERATEEQADFLNMTTNFVGLYNHTEATIELPNPDRSKYIAPGSSGDIGPAIAIPVNSGDKISAEIFALFDNSSSSNNTSAPAGILEAVASTFGTTSGEALYGQFSNTVSSLVSGWSNASSVTPDSYLNLVWVNTTNTTSSFAYDKVEPTAYTNYEPLNVEFTAPGAGTVFIYVANESDQSSTDLFLDDFLVVYEKTTSSLNIVSTANYYPFGMKMDAESYDHLSREKQRYGYNGNEEIDGGGLTLMDFNARIYNPSLGRFMGADALASVSAASSPYAFTSNDPINLIDPTGLTSREWGGSFREHFLANFGYEGSFARNKRIWGAGRTGPGSSYHWSDQYSNRSGLNANFPFINWAISTGNFDKLPQGHYSNDGTGSFSFSHITGAYWRDYDDTYTTGNFYDGDLTVHGRRSELIIETNTNGGGPTLYLAGAGSPRILTAGVGDYLLPAERHYNGSLGLVGAAVGGYNKVPNDVKRRYAYKLSKQTGLKPGRIFQGTKRFVNSTGKLTSKLGPVGTLLTVGVIGYEVGTDTWDAHTIVNGSLLVAAGVATFFAAPAVLVGIAAYGIADYAFDISGTIDSYLGRNSGLWDQ